MAFEFYEGDNVGSLASIKLIEHYKIVSLSPLMLVTGAQWLDIPFKDQTGSLQDKSEQSDNGPVHTYAGGWFVHNQRDEVDDTMRPFIGEVAVIMAEDMNGRVKLIGGPGKPVTIERSANTGTRYTDENGTAFSFRSVQSEEAPVL